MSRKVAVFVFVYAVAAACLVWVFHGVDFRRLGQNLATARWAFFALAALLNVSVYFANTWRWTVLLSPVSRTRFRNALQAIYIGLFLNDVLPLRPGEIARCAFLSKWTRGLNFAVAISSAMIERLFEFSWLAAAFFVLVAFAPVPKVLIYGCSIGSAIVLCMFVLLVVTVRRRSAGERDTGWLARLWYRLVYGLRLMANARTMVIVAAMSLLALFLNVLATWALIRSCGIPLPFLLAAAVLIIIRVGTAIPSTPGSVGAYQFFAVLGLGLFGVDKTAAATFTVLAFAAFTLPLLTAGSVAFTLAGGDFADLVSVMDRSRSKTVAVDTPPGSRPPIFRERIDGR